MTPYGSSVETVFNCLQQMIRCRYVGFAWQTSYASKSVIGHYKWAIPNMDDFWEAPAIIFLLPQKSSWNVRSATCGTGEPFHVCNNWHGTATSVPSCKLTKVVLSTLADAVSVGSTFCGLRCTLAGVSEFLRTTELQCFEKQEGRKAAPSSASSSQEEKYKQIKIKFTKY